MNYCIDRMARVLSLEDSAVPLYLTIVSIPNIQPPSATPLPAKMNVLADAASIASESLASNQDAHETEKSPPKKKGAKLQHILMQLLNEETEPEAIWWLPGEKEFAIDADVFPTRVLEVYFPGSKYASFIRRLHKL